MIYVSLLREQIYFILETMNFDVVSDYDYQVIQTYKAAKALGAER